MATLTAVITLQDNMSAVLQTITQRVNELNVSLQTTNSLISSMPPLNLTAAQLQATPQTQIQTDLELVQNQMKQLQDATASLSQVFTQISNQSQQTAAVAAQIFSQLQEPMSQVASVSSQVIAQIQQQLQGLAATTSQIVSKMATELSQVLSQVTSQIQNISNLMSSSLPQISIQMSSTGTASDLAQIQQSAIVLSQTLERVIELVQSLSVSLHQTSASGSQALSNLSQALSSLSGYWNTTNNSVQTFAASVSSSLTAATQQFEALIALLRETAQTISALPSINIGAIPSVDTVRISVESDMSAAQQQFEQFSSSVVGSFGTFSQISQQIFAQAEQQFQQLDSAISNAISQMAARLSQVLSQVAIQVQQISEAMSTSLPQINVQITSSNVASELAQMQQSASSLSQTLEQLSGQIQLVLASLSQMATSGTETISELLQSVSSATEPFNTINNLVQLFGAAATVSVQSVIERVNALNAALTQMSALLSSMPQLPAVQLQIPSNIPINIKTNVEQVISQLTQLRQTIDEIISSAHYLSYQMEQSVLGMSLQSANQYATSLEKTLQNISAIISAMPNLNLSMPSVGGAQLTVQVDTSQAHEQLSALDKAIVSLSRHITAAVNAMQQIGASASGATVSATSQVQQGASAVSEAVSQVGSQVQQTISSTLGALQGVNTQVASIEGQVGSTQIPPIIEGINGQIKQVPPSIDKIGGSVDKVVPKSQSLLDVWRNIRITVAGIVSLLGLRQIEQLSDEFVLTRARIDLMNDGLQTTQELQDRMFKAATETRNSYLDMAEVVTKLGILAGDVFRSNEELIRFAELMNKNFIVGGSSAREQRAAMYQLTQALASGRLQGDEFRSVLENAPFLAKQIAKELNVNAGQLQKLGSQWKITPEIIKRAMFNTADEIEARFASMPKTMSQIFTMTFNAILQNIQPLITYINRIANYIYDNWSQLEPIFWGLAGAVGTYTGVLIANTIATWAANAATKAFTVTLLGVPLVGIAAAIGLVVSGLAIWINKVGGVRIAWAITADFLEYRLGQLWAYFLAVIGYVNAAFENMQNGLYSMGYSIAYFAEGILAKILGAIDWFVKQAVGAINLVIRGLNLIPGVNIRELTVTSSVQEYQNKIAASQASLAAKMAENDAKLAKSQQAVAQEFAQNMNRLESNHMKRQEDIARMQKEAQEKANAAQPKLPPFPDSLDEVDTVNKVKSIDLAEEDLQLLRELAEIKYVQNFVKLTPSVAVNATISEKVDINEVVRTIEKKLEDEFYAAAEGVYQ